MIGGVFCITTGLYALKIRYPTTFRISAFLTKNLAPTLNRTMTTQPVAPSLSQFLVDNKRRFLEDVNKDAAANWTIVMGNQAGGEENGFPRCYDSNPFARQTSIAQHLPSPIPSWPSPASP
jgi:hypothetical protein